MQSNDDSTSAVEVFFRFQVKDPQTGQPYTVTISQEGVVREHEEVVQENATRLDGADDFDRCYHSHVNADLKVELLADRSVEAPHPSGARPAVQGHHDLRQLLHQ